MTAEETRESEKGRRIDRPLSRQAMPYGRILSGMTGLGGPVGLRACGAPWWIVFLASTLSFTVICLQSVFPQNSADRLAWWRDLRRSRERRAVRRAQKRPATGPGEGG